MGRNYSITDDQTMTASPGDSVLSLVGTTGIRPSVYDVLVGTTGTPVDNALEFFLQNHSADGTGDALTPTPLDYGDPAAGGTYLGNHSVEPTYTAGEIMLKFGLNQRATFRWVASPGSEIVLPASATAGVGLMGMHASYTGLYTGTILFEE
jgi:hypothetical protein